jgi:hypothetical protein
MLVRIVRTLASTAASTPAYTREEAMDPLWSAAMMSSRCTDRCVRPWPRNTSGMMVPSSGR